MIPKVIHYCWFGRGEKPKLAQKCIASWRKYCPDYEIIEWNEDNFDVASTAYMEFCHKNEKWAFLSDYVRLAVVYENGGLYFDTDVEVIRSFDDLLQNEAFFGFENSKFVATGLGFGAEAGNPVLKQMMDSYQFDREDEVLLRGCPALNTGALLPLGLVQDGSFQVLDHAVFFPPDYLNPFDDPTGKLNLTENTYSIHWYAKSALSKKSILRSKITRPFHRLFGVDCFSWIK